VHGTDELAVTADPGYGVHVAGYVWLHQRSAARQAGDGVAQFSEGVGHGDLESVFLQLAGSDMDLEE